MFFSGIVGIEIAFFLHPEYFPFLDDLRYKFRLTHSRELMPILVVLLTGKLVIEFGELLFF